jgi:hypothetical protein
MIVFVKTNYFQIYIFNLINKMSEHLEQTKEVYALFKETNRIINHKNPSQIYYERPPSNIKEDKLRWRRFVSDFDTFEELKKFVNEISSIDEGVVYIWFEKKIRVIR